MPGTVTMYSTTWCGYCRRLKSQMDREGIGYSEVNIEDAVLAGDIFRTLMGDEVEPRRIFIESNARFVSNLDI